MCLASKPAAALLRIRGQALEGTVRLVEDVVPRRPKCKRISEPISKKNFSGKIAFRTTPDVHRELALSAAERGVSLNR